MLDCFWINGRSIIVALARKNNEEELSITNFSVTSNMLNATISDGRIVSIPIKWFSKLAKANLTDLKNFEISPCGYGIHWPTIDEDISINAFINP